jgi:hypothetical protein
MKTNVMMTFRACALSLLAQLLFLGMATAQSPVYVTGSAFADIKRFGSTQGYPYYPYSTDEDFSLDGTGAGGGLRIGTFLTPRWSLELAVDAGSRTKAEFSYPPVVILAIFPPPRLNFKASSEFLTVSTTLGFHPPASGRIQFGYLAGFSFVRATYKSDFPNYGVPVPLFTQGYETLADFRLAGPTSVISSISSSVIYPPIRVSTQTQKRNTGGLVLGFEAAIALMSRLAVVPEVRAFTFSTINGGSSVFLIRPGVGVRWSF